MAKRQAVVIAAASARHGAEAYRSIPPLLLQRGIDVAETYIESSRKSVVKRAARAIKHKAELLVICGGDGTQTSVVPLLACGDTVLGVVPAGTGNSFALGLGLDGAFEGAADAIAYGSVREIDLGTIDDTYFANFVVVGLAADISDDTAHPLKGVLGAGAYAVAGAVPLFTHKPFPAKLRWGKQRVEVLTHQIIIANGRFYGHTAIAPDATLDDGRLTVFVRESHNVFTPIETYVAFLRGNQTALPGVHMWSTGKALTIKTRPKVRVSIDGDQYGRTPVQLGVAPKALRVMVPLGAMPA